MYSPHQSRNSIQANPEGSKPGLKLMVAPIAKAPRTYVIKYPSGAQRQQSAVILFHHVTKLLIFFSCSESRWFIHFPTVSPHVVKGDSRDPLMVSFRYHSQIFRYSSMGIAWVPLTIFGDLPSPQGGKPETPRTNFSCWPRVAIRFRWDIHLAANVHVFAAKVLLLLPEKVAKSTRCVVETCRETLGLFQGSWIMVQLRTFFFFN